MTQVNKEDVVDLYKANAAALMRNPDDVDALINQMALLSDNGDRTNARHYLALAARAYALKPNDIAQMFNYGSALQRAGEFECSAEIYRDCVRVADGDWLARVYHHLGVAFRGQGINRLAIENYRHAIELDPSRLDYKKDLALALMADGQLSEGLQAFEVRKELAYERFKWHEADSSVQRKLPPGVVHWTGEDLTGKSVVIYHEEGIGDLFQFCRFFPMLRARGANALYLTGPVPDALELVADNVAVEGVVPLEAFEADFVVGSMSIPWRCGVELADVAGRRYFNAEPAVFKRRGKINVGLKWRGNPNYGKDVNRSMAFSEFSPLFELPGVAFYSLQVGAPVKEITKLGFEGFVTDLAPFAKTWRDTARLVANLDAVVTVDTAIAHLAGALGAPVFILATAASDWRWRRDTEKTPWYDSATVLRQHKQDQWGPCIEAVKFELELMLHGRRQDAGSDLEGAARSRAA